MKKLITSIMLISGILGFLFASAAFVSAASADSPIISYQPPEQSGEELNQDIYISLLMPYIQKEADQYYSKYLTYNPLVYPYDVYALSVERQNGYRSFLFRVKLQFYSVVGPHIPVGLDSVTVAVGGSGNVTIEEFEHLKSFVLPARYEHIIKEGYHNPIP